MSSIVCPHCHTPLDIDQALSDQLKADLQSQFQQEKIALEQRLKQDLWQKAQVEAKKRAEESSQKIITDLEARVKEQESRTKVAEMAEIELRQKQRQLAEKEKQLQLTLERQLDERLKTEQEKVGKIEAERFSLKEREYLKQIADMRSLVEEAQRKATTVSQQLQGEVLELELQSQLQTTFPTDTIEEVKKGQTGADIIQVVRTAQGKIIGSIVWEAKQTEHFSDKWLPKLREDCRTSHGTVAVLVSKSLPSDIPVCAERDRVWVTSFAFALPLAHLLRQTLIQVDAEKTAQTGKDVKSDMLYRYVNSQEFRGRVEGIVESFREMKEDLDKEQDALRRIWQKREKQILRLATNTAYMYGEMQGLLGASLPSIQGLELESASQQTLSAPPLL